MSFVLETERLFLREFKPKDASTFFELNSDPEVMKHTGDVPFKNVEEALSLIENYNDYQKNGFGRNTVILKSTNEVIGWCGLKKHHDGMVDLGFRLFKKDWNNGYATESSMAILKKGFTAYQLEEIIGRASKNNPASINVLKKLGMRFYKEAPCEGIINSVYYKIIKEDAKHLFS